MCLTVQNLFNDKEIILGREDILEVVKYALEKRIVDISFNNTDKNDNIYRNWNYSTDGELILPDFDYTLSLGWR